AAVPTARSVPTRRSSDLRRLSSPMTPAWSKPTEMGRTPPRRRPPTTPGAYGTVSSADVETVQDGRRYSDHRCGEGESRGHEDGHGCGSDCPAVGECPGSQLGCPADQAVRQDHRQGVEPYHQQECSGGR